MIWHCYCWYWLEHGSKEGTRVLSRVYPSGSKAVVRCRVVMRVDCMTRSECDIMLAYAVISFLRSLARYGARAYLRLWLRTPC